MTRPAGPSECTVDLQVIDEGSEMNTPDRRSLLRGCACILAIAAVADRANGAERLASMSWALGFLSPVRYSEQFRRPLSTRRVDSVI